MSMTPVQIEKLLESFLATYEESGGIPEPLMMLYLLQDSVANFNELNTRMSKALAECIQRQQTYESKWVVDGALLRGSGKDDWVILHYGDLDRPWAVMSPDIGDTIVLKAETLQECMSLVEDAEGSEPGWLEVPEGYLATVAVHDYWEKCSRVLYAVGLESSIGELPEPCMTWEDIVHLENE